MKIQRRVLCRVDIRFYNYLAGLIKKGKCNMSKKRFFGAVTAAAIALSSICFSVLADEGVKPEEPKTGVIFSVADADNDIIRLDVTNKDLDGKQVSLYVFNPGKNVTDLTSDGSEAARDALYQAIVIDFKGTSNDFNLKIRQPSDENHVYNYLLISQTGDKMTGSFEYFTKAEKDALLKEINEAERIPDKLSERIYSNFGLQTFKLYESVNNKDKISDIVFKNVKDIEVTYDNIAGFFEEAVVIAAFCESGEALLENNKCAYMSFVNPAEDYLKYYNENLNDNGTRDSILNICKNNYNSMTEIRTALEKEIIVNAVNNNKLKGYGHIETIIRDFENEFSNAGLKLSAYNSSDRDRVGSQFMQKVTQSTLEDISKTINEIVDGLNKSSSQGSSSRPSGTSGGPVSSKGPKADNSSSIAAPVTSDPDIKDNAPTEVIFSDLEGYEWAKKSITALYKNNIISGRGEGKFSPAETITREEFTVILVNAFKLGDASNAPKFDDVNSDRWSYEYITKAFSAGIISGDGRNFMPQNRITRQDIAAILVRTLMSKGTISDVEPAMGVFDDEADISSYAIESVQIMSELGVISGDGTGNFRPKDNATRAEAAVIVHRALELL